MICFLQGPPIKAQWAMLVWTGKLLTAATNGAKNVENYCEQNEKKTGEQNVEKYLTLATKPPTSVLCLLQS